MTRRQHADSDEEVRERLHDHDYEDGQWIGGEYFASGKRQKRGQTREEQIYGVFADSSGDEADRGRKRGPFGGDGVKKDYTKPVGFVSSGIRPGDDQKKQEVDDPDARPSFATDPPSTSGLGAAPARGGLGAGSGPSFQRSGRAAAQHSDDDDDKVLPTALGQRWVGPGNWLG